LSTLSPAEVIEAELRLTAGNAALKITAALAIPIIVSRIVTIAEFIG
jgi:hypothetical protein